MQAPDVGLEAYLDELAEDHPLGQAIRGTLAALGVKRLPACTVRISSTIPVAAGLRLGGSGFGGDHPGGGEFRRQHFAG